MLVPLQQYTADSFEVFGKCLFRNNAAADWNQMSAIAHHPFSARQASACYGYADQQVILGRKPVQP